MEAVQSQHQEVVTPLDTRKEEEGLCHGPRLSNFLGLDPDHILMGGGHGSLRTCHTQPQLLAPGLFLGTMHPSHTVKRAECAVGRELAGFQGAMPSLQRLHASQGWAGGCKAKPARPSGLAVFFAKKLPGS